MDSLPGRESFHLEMFMGTVRNLFIQRASIVEAMNQSNSEVDAPDSVKVIVDQLVTTIIGAMQQVPTKQRHNIARVVNDIWWELNTGISSAYTIQTLWEEVAIHALGIDNISSAANDNAVADVLKVTKRKLSNGEQ